MIRIGRFTDLEFVGDGGMGCVYKGIDPMLGSTVAIKVIHDHLASEAGVLDRFKNEAVIEARLQHPNIIRVQEFILEDNVAAMVMEYIEGHNLKDFMDIQGRPLDLDLSQRILDQALAAIGHAHQADVIHRDIKPSNMMVSQFHQRIHISVMDFGVAKILGNEQLRTNPNAKMGSIAYASPEQIRSPGDVDNRADIYSLGVVLYEMLTGVIPFDDDSEYGLMSKVIREDPIPPHERNSSVPEEVSELIVRAMAKDREARPSTCEQLWDDFLSAVSQARQPIPDFTTTDPGAAEPKDPDGIGRNSASGAGTVSSPGVGTVSQGGVPEASAPGTEAMTVPPGENPVVRKLLWITLSVVIVLGTILVVVLQGRDPRSGTTSGPVAGGGSRSRQVERPVRQSTGTLIVTLDVAGYASVDGVITPDGGSKLSQRHVFSNLEATSHGIQVWKKGQQPSKPRRVTIPGGGEKTERFVLSGR